MRYRPPWERTDGGGALVEAGPSAEKKKKRAKRLEMDWQPEEPGRQVKTDMVRSTEGADGKHPTGERMSKEEETDNLKRVVNLPLGEVRKCIEAQKAWDRKQAKKTRERGARMGEASECGETPSHSPVG